MEIKIKYKDKDIVLDETDIIVLYIMARHGTPITQTKIEAIYFLYKKVAEDGKVG